LPCPFQIASGISYSPKKFFFFFFFFGSTSFPSILILFFKQPSSHFFLLLSKNKSTAKYFFFFCSSFRQDLSPLSKGGKKLDEKKSFDGKEREGKKGFFEKKREGRKEEKLFSTYFLRPDIIFPAEKERQENNRKKEKTKELFSRTSSS